MDKIPVTTLNRYPLYLRILKNFKSKGIKKVLSQTIAKEMEVKDTTVRRDFTYLGRKGRQGYGYDVDDLISAFTCIIGNVENEDIVLVGVGNMGKALLKYNYFEDKVGKIVCGFDLYEENIEGCEVYHINDLETKFPKGVKIAIITVPKEHLQPIVDRLVALGIKAFINFSDGEIKTKRKVIVHKIDLAAMVQEVLFKFIEN